MTQQYAESILTSSYQFSKEIYGAYQCGQATGNWRRFSSDMGNVLTASAMAALLAKAPQKAVVQNGGGDALTTMELRLKRLGYDQPNATRILQSIQNGEQVAIIGENMDRVGAVANMVNKAGGKAVTYTPRNFTGVNTNTLEADRSWLRYWVKEKGAPAIDIGRQPTPRPTGPSPFYGLENRSLNRWGIYTPFAE